MGRLMAAALLQAAAQRRPPPVFLLRTTAAWRERIVVGFRLYALAFACLASIPARQLPLVRARRQAWRWRQRQLVIWCEQHAHGVGGRDGEACRFVFWRGGQCLASWLACLLRRCRWPGACWGGARPSCGSAAQRRFSPQQSVSWWVGGRGRLPARSAACKAPPPCCVPMPLCTMIRYCTLPALPAAPPVCAPAAATGRAVRRHRLPATPLRHGKCGEHAVAEERHESTTAGWGPYIYGVQPARKPACSWRCHAPQPRDSPMQVYSSACPTACVLQGAAAVAAVGFALPTLVLRCIEQRARRAFAAQVRAAAGSL